MDIEPHALSIFHCPLKRIAKTEEKDSPVFPGRLLFEKRLVMLSLTTICLFSAATVLLALTPGPDMLYIATRSLTQGRSAGVVSALGVHAGVLVHTLAAALGISALIAASAVAFNLVRFLGAAYLIYIGIQAMLSNGDAVEIKAREHSRLRDIFYQGLFTNILNPKVILFFLAFLPQFVDPSKGSTALQLLSLGMLMFSVSLPIDIAIGLLGGSVGNWLNRNKGIRQSGKWVTGAVFVSMGIGTALFGGRGS